MGRTIGIELGISHAACACVRDGEAEAITFRDGSRSVPSLFAIDGWGRFEPLDAAALGPPESPPHLFGVPSGSEAIRRLVTFELQAAGGELRIEAAGQRFSLEQMFVVILGQLVEAAADVFDDDVDSAVIVVPDGFDDDRCREAVRSASRRIGLGVWRLMPEAQAAALDHKFQGGLHSGLHQRVAVYNLSSRSFSFTLIDIRDKIFDTVASRFDPLLGGVAFDDALARWAMQALWEETGLDLSGDPSAVARLLAACEQARVRLSTEDEVTLSLERSGEPDGVVPIDLHLQLTRDRLEALTSDLVDRSIGTCAAVLAQADITWADLDEILLVGGPSAMPMVRRRLTDLAKPPARQFIPALGAASFGHYLAHRDHSGDMRGLGILLAPIGVETPDGSMRVLFKKYQCLPDERVHAFETSTDQQHEMVLRIYQGLAPLTTDNAFLGAFVIRGTRGAIGELSVDARFSIVEDDNHYLLSLRAADRRTGDRLLHKTISVRPPAVGRSSGRAGLVIPAEFLDSTP
ncbi:MAG: Hsp70 family protein [Myxococcota bacterium]